MTPCRTDANGAMALMLLLPLILALNLKKRSQPNPAGRLVGSGALTW
jgi:hypothetical protein